MKNFILKQWQAKQELIFLVDAIGALVTAFLIGKILPQFPTLFKMPIFVLNILAAIASCFTAYSLSCYFFVKNKVRIYLTIIAITNCFYCLATLVLLIVLFNQISLFDVAYFFGEVVIIGVLLTIEFRIIKKHLL